jgi:CDP-diacylglycerol--serine O-phosphatidyltransferase
MIREFHLADLFTLANAASGVASVFTSMDYLTTRSRGQFLLAAALLPLALVFDVLDGRIARWRQRHSAIGRELDSLADIISFGVGPAALAHAAGLTGVWDRVVLIYFVACGVSRLARFNVTAVDLAEGTDKVKYFEGTPIPTSVVLVAVLAVAALRGRLSGQLWWGQFEFAGGTLHPLVVLFAISGSLMISKTIRIPKL